MAGPGPSTDAWTDGAVPLRRGGTRRATQCPVIVWAVRKGLSVGLFSSLLFWPLTPVRGVLWLAEQVHQEAESDLADREAIARQRMDLDEALRAGDLTPRRHAELVAELREQQEAE